MFHEMDQRCSKVSGFKFQITCAMKIEMMTQQTYRISDTFLKDCRMVIVGLGNSLYELREL